MAHAIQTITRVLHFHYYTRDGSLQISCHSYRPLRLGLAIESHGRRGTTLTARAGLGGGGVGGGVIDISLANLTGSGVGRGREHYLLPRSISNRPLPYPHQILSQLAEPDAFLTIMLLP